MTEPNRYKPRLVWALCGLLFLLIVLGAFGKFNLYEISGSTLSSFRNSETGARFFGQLKAMNILGRNAELQDAVMTKPQGAAPVAASNNGTLDTLKRIQVSPRKKGLVVGYRFGGEESPSSSSEEP